MKFIGTKLNIIFAVAIATVPMIMSLVDLLGLYIALPYYVMIWGIGYGLCLLFGSLKYFLHGGKCDFKVLKNPLSIIVICMLVWILLSSIINRVFNIYLIIYFTYFLIYICVFGLSAKWKKYLINILLVSVAISCLMGFVYMYNKSMPGLDNEVYYVALHFTNPNYAAHIVGALALVCFIQFDKASTKLWNVFYLIIYLIYATHLFVNGSFAGITFFIMLQIIIQIIVGIKSKKIHFKMLVLSLILFPICLLVDLLPNIQIMRTCAYNYLVECVAVFDNIFNTNLLSKFGIDWVAGADGWNRSELVALSWKERLSSPKSFIFGGGAGLFYQYRPHNAILSLMLDFGVVLSVLFILCVGCLIVKIIKNKIGLSKLVYLPTIICFVMCYMTGSIVPNSFYVFMIILALLFSDIFTQQDCK